MSDLPDASSASLNVRRADPGDLDRIDGLEAGAFDADRFARRNLRRLLASRSAAVFIAEREGNALGYALVLFRKGARVARLYSIAVAEEARGTGVVAELLGRCQREAVGRGCSLLRLEVRASNARARRAYERAGFREAGRRADYYPDGEAGVVMERELHSGAGGQST